MSTPLRVLIVDDSPADAELLVRELKRAGYEPHWQCVQDEKAYAEALVPGLDLILCDYHMPGFNGIAALEILKSLALDIPFILISGVMGEEAAVAAMKRGAADYLMKDRLARLGVAVEHALSEFALSRQRRATEKELLLFRALIDRSKDTFEILDPATGRYLDVNGKGLSDWGYSRATYLGLTIFDLDPSMTWTLWDDWLVALQGASTATMEGLHRRRDDTVVAVEYDAAWVVLERTYVVTVVRDVSVRKRDEQRLRQSEARFRDLAETITEVFWISDPPKSRILYVSPGYARVWGRTCESLYDEPDSWIEAVHPEDLERVRQSLDRLASGEYCEEYRILAADGAERWIRDRAFPVRSSGGVVERIVGVAEDITDAKRLQEQFLRAQRMEALGTLAGGVAHDLNNILAPILIAPTLIRESTTDAHALELLTMIEQSAQRGSTIVRQLLTFSRGAVGKRVPVHVNTIIDDMAAIMRETFPKNVVVETFCSADVKPVLGDPTQLHQVVMNLCVNARDAMPQGGRLWLCASNEDLTEADLERHPGAKPGLFTCLAVTDTGQGIPFDVIGRIFDPFFTTKAPTRGTGLGLSTALGIVRSHGGFIDVTSMPNLGTTFTVHLRSLREPGPSGRGQPPPTSKRGRGELILLVETDPTLRAATRLMLERSGYRVLGASTFPEALDLLHQYTEAVQLVIADVRTPDAAGPRFVDALTAAKPGVKILALGDVPGGSSQRGGFEANLPKPCDPATLLRAVNAQLEVTAAARPFSR